MHLDMVGGIHLNTTDRIVPSSNFCLQYSAVLRLFHLDLIIMCFHHLYWSVVISSLLAEYNPAQRKNTETHCRRTATK